jgi:SAM-dependent methyltransferase
MPPLKAKLKHAAFRLMRPGLLPLERRAADIDARTARIEDTLERLAGATIDRDKHREELGYWRWLITTDAGLASLHAPFDQVFGAWQRDRLRELARVLRDLPRGTDVGPARSVVPSDDLDSALDAWCTSQSVVEIGAGPYPAIAAAPRWRRAVSIDPLAKSYAEEGLLPHACHHITYLEAPGENTPLPAAFADLVIIENALDHVSDPAAVLREARRLLRDGGLLWLLVDLSHHTDHMHPNPFDEPRIRALLTAAGFHTLHERTSDHKSHPKAYGEYRALLQRPATTIITAPR